MPIYCLSNIDPVIHSVLGPANRASAITPHGTRASGSEALLGLSQKDCDMKLTIKREQESKYEFLIFGG